MNNNVAPLHKYRFNSDLYQALEDVIDQYAGRVSVPEAIGVLELLKTGIIRREGEGV